MIKRTGAMAKRVTRTIIRTTVEQKPSKAKPTPVVKIPKGTAKKGGTVDLIDDAIVQRVSECLSRRWQKENILSMMCEYLGKKLGKGYHVPSRETSEKIFTLAREDMAKRLDLDTRYHKGNAIEFYESIIRDPDSTNTERLRAQERIDNVLGIDAKFGQKTEAAESTARKLREALKLMHEVTTGVITNDTSEIDGGDND